MLSGSPIVLLCSHIFSHKSRQEISGISPTPLSEQRAQQCPVKVKTFRWPKSQVQHWWHCFFDASCHSSTQHIVTVKFWTKDSKIWYKKRPPPEEGLALAAFVVSNLEIWTSCLPLSVLVGSISAGKEATASHNVQSTSALQIPFHNGLHAQPPKDGLTMVRYCTRNWRHKTISFHQLLSKNKTPTACTYAF